MTQELLDAITKLHHDSVIVTENMSNALEVKISALAKQYQNQKVEEGPPKMDQTRVEKEAKEAVAKNGMAGTLHSTDVCACVPGHL